ncbi:MAG: copper chaperone PCu(A)C [Rubrivivax sp.]
MKTRTRWLMSACLVALMAMAQAQTAAPVPTVQAGWARPTVAGQAAGGGFVSFKGGTSADRLVAASSPVAKAVELHTMEMDGSVMRMRQVQGIDVPAGATVALKPGGNHLMFMGLKQPLKAGDKVPLTLRFENAGEVQTEMTVSMQPPDGSAAPLHDHKH